MGIFDSFIPPLEKKSAPAPRIEKEAPPVKIVQEKKPQPSLTKEQKVAKERKQTEDGLQNFITRRGYVGSDGRPVKIEKVTWPTPEEEAVIAELKEEFEHVPSNYANKEVIHSCIKYLESSMLFDSLDDPDDHGKVRRVIESSLSKYAHGMTDTGVVMDEKSKKQFEKESALYTHNRLSRGAMMGQLATYSMLSDEGHLPLNLETQALFEAQHEHLPLPWDDDSGTVLKRKYDAYEKEEKENVSKAHVKFVIAFARDLIREGSTRVQTPELDTREKALFKENQERVAKQTKESEKLVARGDIQKYEIWKDEENFSFIDFDAVDDPGLESWGPILMMYLHRPIFVDGVNDTIDNVKRKPLMKKLEGDDMNLLNFYKTNKLRSNGALAQLAVISNIIEDSLVMPADLVKRFQEIRFEFNGTDDPVAVEPQRYKAKMDDAGRLAIVRDIVELSENILRFVRRKYKL